VLGVATSCRVLITFKEKQNAPTYTTWPCSRKRTGITAFRAWAHTHSWVKVHRSRSRAGISGSLFGTASGFDTASWTIKEIG